MSEFLDDSYGGMGYYAQIENLIEEIEQEIESEREFSRQAAEAEREYRMLLSAMTAKERMHGTPVTVISDLCRGDKEIADAKVRWKAAEADAKASQHLHFLKKDRLAILQRIAEREWFRPSNA